jgi:Leucine-rich repeat (LRR) protein
VYINSITLSNQTISASGPSNLDQALAQLLQSNARQGVQLSPCIEADRKRLRQRFAYFALAYSTGAFVDFDDDNECNWGILRCNVNGTVTIVYSSDDRLVGSIPADVGLWTGLTAFTLEGNRALTGTLPATIGLWTSLEYFTVYENNLNGALPSSIGAWTALKQLDIDQNQFSGVFPSSAGAWIDIDTVYMQNNKFTGPLPSSIGGWAKVRYIDITNSGFSGPLPASIGKWTKLEEFYPTWMLTV